MLRHPGSSWGVRCLAQGHLSRGIEGGGSSWGFGVLLKGTSVVVLKVEGAVGGSVSCSRAPQSWYWRWREQLGVQCLAQGSHLSRGIEGRESSWGFGVLLKGTSVVVLKVERAVGGSVSCSRTPQSWYWRWREQLGVQCLAQGHLSRGIEGGGSSWGFGALLKSTSVVVLKVERAVWGSVSCSRVSPQSWYWRWREQLGVQCLAQEHLSRGIEGGGSSWGFSALLKSTSVVVLKVEGAVGGSVPCSRAPQSWYWRWREQLGVQCLAQEHLSRGIKGGGSSWGFSVLLEGTSSWWLYLHIKTADISSMLYNTTCIATERDTHCSFVWNYFHRLNGAKTDKIKGGVCHFLYNYVKSRSWVPKQTCSQSAVRGVSTHDVEERAFSAHDRH